MNRRLFQLCESGPSGTGHGRSMTSFRCSRKTRSSCWPMCARSQARSVTHSQQGRADRIAKRARNSLRTFPRVGRQTKIQGRLVQHCVARPVIPRVRRLHVDGAIPKGIERLLDVATEAGPFPRIVVVSAFAPHLRAQRHSRMR